MAKPKKKPAAPELHKVTLNMLDTDLAKARALAEQQGIGYQVYLRLLVHDALAKQEASRW